MSPRVTADNVTDEQIGDLARAAGQAGDEAQVELCERALGAGEGGSGCSDVEIRDARRVCAEVIDLARANAADRSEVAS